jgi:hypothetical protein
VGGLELLHAGLHGADELVPGSLLGGIRVHGREQVREGRITLLADGGVEGEGGVPAAAEEVPVAVAGEVDGKASAWLRRRAMAAAKMRALWRFMISAKADSSPELKRLTSWASWMASVFILPKYIPFSVPRRG